KDSSANALLIEAKHRNLANRLGGTELPIVVAEDARPSLGMMFPSLVAHDVAYILYTSGSTGRPKGVVQNHRNVLHFIAAYTNSLHICPDDTLTLMSSYSVDAAVMDIFGALLNGATLCPIDIRSVGLRGVCERLNRDGITIYHSTPTLYRHLVTALAERRTPPTVRLVVLGGEEVRGEDVESY